MCFTSMAMLLLPGAGMRNSSSSVSTARSRLEIVFGSEPEEFFGQPRRETRAKLDAL